MELTPADMAMNEFIRAGRSILLIVLSDAGGGGQEGLSVCITSHLLGHNVETEPLHYLALHGCPPSCARTAPQPSGTGRKIVLYNLQWSMCWSKPGPFTACRDDLYTVCTQ